MFGHGKEYSCSTCSAQCCRAMTFYCDKATVDILREGNQAIEVFNPKEMNEKTFDYDGDDAFMVVFQERLGEYVVALTGVCGHLNRGYECTIYERRPASCQKYKEGGTDCKRIYRDRQ